MHVHMSNRIQGLPTTMPHETECNKVVSASVAVSVRLRAFEPGRFPRTVRRGGIVSVYVHMYMYTYMHMWETTWD